MAWVVEIPSQIHTVRSSAMKEDIVHLKEWVV
jgi:hypothetical protein